jgi:Tol biopolymer transport system component
VVFESDASNLVSNDTNRATDVFVVDTETGQIERVSVDSSGNQGNGDSYYADISADGRYVAFASDAENLVSGDTNRWTDIFRHDRQTGETILISVAYDGGLADFISDAPSLSADGNRVAFYSYAKNLVAVDTNGAADVFVRDVAAGRTILASVSSEGRQGNNHSFVARLSPDGVFVGFDSYASNLVPNDKNNVRDLFAHNLETGETELISVSSEGKQTDKDSFACSFSGDDRYVAFYSYSDRLVNGDTNGVADVFVRDRQARETVRVSEGPNGRQGDNGSWIPVITGDARYLVFYSLATNLTDPPVQNGRRNVYLRDMTRNQTYRLTFALEGGDPDHECRTPVISADGRWVAYCAWASNLVEGDKNRAEDIFLRAVALPQVSPRLK